MSAEYHKIDSVFLRDPETKFRTFLTGEWSRPEFGYLADAAWTWTEKIDGTNIRVMWDGQRVTFGGRTDDAQMPTHLLTVLADMFPAAKLLEVFGDRGGITLYGEGYGAKIQKGGGLYIPNRASFILFDISGGDTWFQRADVESMGRALGIDVVPVVGSGTLHGAINMVMAGLTSACAAVTREAEGLVMRPAVELRDRMGRRIITKVKARDFAAPSNTREKEKAA